MALHSPSSGPHHHLEAYLLRLQTVLDRYKQGDISETEAIDQHSAHVVRFQHQLTEAFVIRMRTSESFRTPRGESFEPKVGR